MLLQSWDLAEAARSQWRAFVAALAAERHASPARTLVLTFAAGGARLPGLGSVQQTSTKAGIGGQLSLAGSPAAAHCQRHRPAPEGAREKIAREGGNIDDTLIDRERLFLSHAKVDGWTVEQATEEHLSSNQYGVETFVDVTDLPGGTRFDRQFEAEIARSALVVIRSDRHGSRPWCRWEVLRGKCHHRPLLVVDLIERGEPRIFPYTGNVPAMRAILSTPPAGRTPRRRLRRRSDKRLRFVPVPPYVGHPTAIL